MMVSQEALKVWPSSLLKGCLVVLALEVGQIVDLSFVEQVAEVVAGAKGLSVEEVAFVSRKNAYDLFGGLEKKKIDEEEK